MPAAARIGDSTGHPGAIAGEGVPSVLIGGQPAAVFGNTHVCSLPPPAGPHPIGTLTGGSATVRIGKRRAARVGDTASCGAPIVTGALTVLIGG
jgi:uncharacterized Zn-binding protein involved in type VI secretion